jgi:DNA-binding MarR family transcriptional regulator
MGSSGEAPMDITVVPESIRDFLRSARTFTAAVDALAEEQLQEISGDQLTTAQLRLLRLVAPPDARTISEVATCLRVSAPAASKAVDKLVQQDLLQRTQADVDRRATHLSLTESGCRLLERIEAAKFRALESIFGRTSTEQLRLVAKALDDLSVGLVNLTASPDDICLRCGVYDRQQCVLRDLVGRTCVYHRGQRSGGAKPR